MAPDSRPSVIDVFCGCGGLSEGFNQAGFEVVLGVDCDRWAIRTYRHHSNRGRMKNVEDIDSNYIFAETGTKDINVLVGGPPCRAFSSVSVAKWKSLGMPVTLRHPLNRLYKEFLRIVDETGPKFFVIENVERMLSISGGTVRQVIESELQNKYKINFYIKDVADFGVPQYIP
jgi:DNA (cytosine-5)-methyltransferase 1